MSFIDCWQSSLPLSLIVAIGVDAMYRTASIFQAVQLADEEWFVADVEMAAALANDQPLDIGNSYIQLNIMVPAAGMPLVS